jgi:hypothetical protein
LEGDNDLSIVLLAQVVQVVSSPGAACQVGDLFMELRGELIADFDLVFIGGSLRLIVALRFGGAFSYHYTRFTNSVYVTFFAIAVDIDHSTAARTAFQSSSPF